MVTILSILTADHGVSAALIAATTRFFENGCIDSGPARIVVEGGLMMTKSAGARFLGLSRQQFAAVAETIINGAPQFTEHFVAQEKHPRYSKIELIEYASKRNATHQAVPAFKIAC